MSALPGGHYCLAHQGNHSHYATENCEVCKLERQVAALTKERDELKNDVVAMYPFKAGYAEACECITAQEKSIDTLYAELAASQAREKLLCELQWKNIRHVVSTLADWAFGSKDDPRWGTAWIAMTTGLSAKDGPQFTLELLPTDDSALQARLKEEQERVYVELFNQGHINKQSLQQLQGA